MNIDQWEPGFLGSNPGPASLWLYNLQKGAWCVWALCFPTYKMGLGRG